MIFLASQKKSNPLALLLLRMRINNHLTGPHNGEGGIGNILFLLDTHVKEDVIAFIELF
jgi:hypothetical protein